VEIAFKYQCKSEASRLTGIQMRKRVIRLVGALLMLTFRIAFLFVTGPFLIRS
jgi:hypothetical protein